MFLKATDIDKAAPTIGFFAVLGAGFALPNVALPPAAVGAAILVWITQAYIPAFAYILIMQMTTQKLPTGGHISILLVPLVGPPLAYFWTVFHYGCSGPCPQMIGSLAALTVLPGSLLLILLFFERKALLMLRQEASSNEAYWVVLTLIVFSIINLVGVDLARALELLSPASAAMTRTMFGLIFVYLITTLVFRIDPKVVVLLPGMATRQTMELNEDELALADRIRDLMALDKLYQEPSYSRTDLARELDVSESIVSRVINVAFCKTFRQLMNQHRIDEAKLLLVGSDVQVTPIAYDVGFNSLVSFNRVFKELTSMSPTEYRTSVAESDAAAEESPAPEEAAPEEAAPEDADPATPDEPTAPESS